MRRPLVAAALLLAIYGALSLLTDPRGYLGTDTGGKVATLKVMDERGRLDPDIGYWAERWDADGRFHPLYYTSHLGDRWVNVTTLPALYTAYPLYRLGGYRLALLVPMLGSVAAALAARRLVRHLRPEADGWAAFWLVGLASPMTIYALDFWEHSLGVALIAWAAVLIVDVVCDSPRLWRAVVAGCLLGLAATMRTEALVYAAVAIAALGVGLLVRRTNLVRAAGLTAAAAVPVAALWFANGVLERATVGSDIRATRASGVLSASEGGASRFEEAALTALSLHPALEPTSYLLGAGLLALLVWAAFRSRRGDEGPAVVALAGAGALYVLRFADGLGFVPGMVAASPIVAVAVLGRRLRAAPLIAGVALVALPVVWALQYQGGAAPQWAGRYILPSGLLLAAVGMAWLPELGPNVRRGLVAFSVAVTAFGVAWLVERSHSVASASETLTCRPEPVLVSRVHHLPREGGAFYDEKRWLVAPGDADVAAAGEVVRDAGFASFGLVDLVQDEPATPAVPGFRPEPGRDRVRYFRGVDLDVVTYVSDEGRLGDRAATPARCR